MREDEKNWFSRWEEDLPSFDELMPINQTLITPDLALAFDIRHPNNSNTSQAPPPPPPSSQQPPQHQLNNITPPITPPLLTSTHPNSAEFENSPELGGSGTGGDEPARTLKRPRLVWTPQLHKRFVEAVAHLGIKNAVPKTIMQLMSVDGLTRENVASHLQKYRLYLKRMQGLSGGGGGNGGNGGLVASDPATDHLFASSPVPAHLLPFVQSPQAGGPIWVAHPQLQQQFHQQRQVGHFGSPPNGGQFELPFMARQSQQVHRMGAPLHNSVPAAHVEDLESATANGGRKVLTLFPTGDD